MRLPLFFLSIIFLHFYFSANAQNSTYIWKNGCNCGPGNILIQDDNLNTYVTSKGTGAFDFLSKLDAAGQQVFNQQYIPPGFTTVDFTDGFYHDGHLYLAALLSSPLTSEALMLLKIDTSGFQQDIMILDSILPWAITDSYGLYKDQQDNIHIAYNYVSSAPLDLYSLVKYDLNFNLISYFEDPIPFNKYRGEFYFKENGSVYFSITGALKKLNSSHSGIEWTYPFSNDFDIHNITETNLGDLVFLMHGHDSAGTIYTLTRIADTIGGYNVVFDQNLPRGLKHYDHLHYNAATDIIYTTAHWFPTSLEYRYVYAFNASDGNLAWVDSALDGQNISKLISDTSNNLISAGGGTDYKIWFYDNLGNITDTIIYDGWCGSDDWIEDILITEDNKIYVTGAACEAWAVPKYATTIKYDHPNTPVAVEEIINKSELKIYPVPAKNKITVTHPFVNAYAEIMDVTGKTVLHLALKNDEINISGISPGIYTLRVFDNHNSIHQNIVIAE